MSHLVYAIYRKPDPTYMILVKSFADPYGIDGKSCELVDDRDSGYWKTGPVFPQKGYRITSFPEWADNDGFFEELINSGRSPSMTWDHYRSLMELEFIDPGITLEAASLGDGWYQCGSCMEAWKDVTTNEMSACMACEMMQRKPNI